MKPAFALSNNMMNLIAKISRMGGELVSTARSPKLDFDIRALVNAESVHYSTKIEGNSLTLKEVTTTLQKKLEIKIAISKRF